MNKTLFLKYLLSFVLLLGFNLYSAETVSSFSSYQQLNPDYASDILNEEFMSSTGELTEREIIDFYTGVFLKDKNYLNLKTVTGIIKSYRHKKIKLYTATDLDSFLLGTYLPLAKGSKLNEGDKIKIYYLFNVAYFIELKQSAREIKLNTYLEQAEELRLDDRTESLIIAEQYLKKSLEFADQKKKLQISKKIKGLKTSLANRYQSLINRGDSLFNILANSEEFYLDQHLSAKKYYQDALCIKDYESYPKKKISMINNLLQFQKREVEKLYFGYFKNLKEKVDNLGKTEQFSYANYTETKELIKKLEALSYNGQKKDVDSLVERFDSYNEAYLQKQELKAKSLIEKKKNKEAIKIYKELSLIANEEQKIYFINQIIILEGLVDNDAEFLAKLNNILANNENQNYNLLKKKLLNLEEIYGERQIVKEHIQALDSLIDQDFLKAKKKADSLLAFAKNEDQFSYHNLFKKTDLSNYEAASQEYLFANSLKADPENNERLNEIAEIKKYAHTSYYSTLCPGLGQFKVDANLAAVKYFAITGYSLYNSFAKLTSFFENDDNIEKSLKEYKKNNTYANYQIYQRFIYQEDHLRNQINSNLFFTLAFYSANILDAELMKPKYKYHKLKLIIPGLLQEDYNRFFFSKLLEASSLVTAIYGIYRYNQYLDQKVEVENSYIDFYRNKTGFQKVKNAESKLEDCQDQLIIAGVSYALVHLVNIADNLLNNESGNITGSNSNSYKSLKMAPYFKDRKFGVSFSWKLQ